MAALVVAQQSWLDEENEKKERRREGTARSTRNDTAKDVEILLVCFWPAL